MIGLVSCSAQKLAHAAPARELYSSPLFRRSLAYAEVECDVVYVLSAAYGIVALDRELAPYDRRLGGKREREAWGQRAASVLISRHGRESDYVILAGRDYAVPLATALCTHDGWHDGGWRGVAANRIVTPLAGMGIGDRLRWLNEQLGEPAG